MSISREDFEIRDRIKLVREHKDINMSQSAFGNRLSLERSAISLIERKQRNATDRIIKDICREFNINEEWLRTGKGDMFVELAPDDEFIAAAAELSRDNDKLAMQAVIEYWKLDENSKQLFRDFLIKIVENSKNKE